MDAAMIALHAVAPARPETSFELALCDEDVGERGFQILLSCERHGNRGGLGVDWGDGTWNEWTDRGRFVLWHDYAAPGTYRVRMDAGLKWFRLDDAYAVTRTGALIRRPAVRPLVWGDSVESARATYNGWNKWYGDMKGVWGEPPPWGRNISTALGCFEGCRCVSGRVPEWPSGIEDCARTFAGTAVSGRVPRWPRGLAAAYGCYEGCSGLAGRIPPWPAALVDVERVFAGCTGLAGAWTDDPALLAPARMERHAGAVEGASDALRALFPAAWGGVLGGGPA